MYIEELVYINHLGNSLERNQKKKEEEEKPHMYRSVIITVIGPFTTWSTSIVVLES